MFYPTIMQPTHARWEQIPPPSEASAEQKLLTNGLTNGHHLTNGDSIHDDAMELETTTILPRHTKFPAVPAGISRNYTIVDVLYEAPPISGGGAGFPGPDGAITDPTAGTTGLSAIAPELVAELPADCRAAFEAARSREARWQHRWDTEARSGHRAPLKIGLNGYPV